MFETNHSYSGSFVAPEESAEGIIAIDSPNHSHHLDPKQFIDQAKEQAELIIQEAQQKAEEIKLEAKAQAQNEARSEIAKIANDARTDLGLGIWSSQQALGDIVAMALERMIGQIGESEACYMAIKQASRDYVADKKFTVYAEPTTANRLRLIHMGETNDTVPMPFEVVDDFAVEAGTCILHMGAKKVEVSVDSQIQAMRNSITTSINRLSKKQANQKDAS